MPISIYYTATRKTPLSGAETAQATAIAERYSVDDSIRRYLASGEGLNWESFDLQLNGEPARLFRQTTVLSGATRLPDNSDDATWTGVQHWCHCLSEIRNALPGCQWQVHVEDHEIHWDTALMAFDAGR